MIHITASAKEWIEIERSGKEEHSIQVQLHTASFMISIVLNYLRSRKLNCKRPKTEKPLKGQENSINSM